MKAVWTAELEADMINMHGMRIPVETKIGQLWKHEGRVYEVIKIGNDFSKNEITLRDIQTDEKAYMIHDDYHSHQFRNEWEQLS